MQLKHGDRVEHKRKFRDLPPLPRSAVRCLPVSAAPINAPPHTRAPPGPYTDATKHERCDTAYTAWPAPCMQQPGDPGDKLARWPRRLVGTDVHGEDAGGARHGLR